MKAKTLTKETILDFGMVDRGFPEFRVGDTIQVAQFVKDGEKERTQIFCGDIIAFSRNGISTTFTIRKIGANGVGVEKILPYYSKNISEIKIIKRGQVRRAKLNYLRDRLGRAARIKEKILTKKQKDALNARDGVTTNVNDQINDIASDYVEKGNQDDKE
jgi:large subunit ribosomal protein L19